MVAAVGMGAFVAGIFHLVMHAFFKALLFLSAGSVIQGIERGEEQLEHVGNPHKRGKHEAPLDPQDMRNMGGLRHKMKTTFWVYLIAALAISGIIPFAGFWSKDEILAEANHLNPAIFWLLLIAAFLTAFYMGRQIIMVFFGTSRTEAAAHATESKAIVTAPLIILAVLSIIGGALNFPPINSLTNWLGHTFQAVAGGAASGEAAPVPFNFIVAAASTVIAVGALVLAWYLYDRRTREMQRLPLGQRADDPLRPALGPAFTLLENKYWIDELYGYIIIKPYQWLANFLGETFETKIWHDFIHDIVLVGGFHLQTRFLSGAFDLGFIDGITNFLGDGFKELGAQLRKIETGFVRNYALAIFIGVIIVIGYILLRAI